MPNRKIPKPPPQFDPDAVSNSMDFDSLEDRIRGDDRMRESENKKKREEAEIKKKLDSAEVDRRLEELKKKIKKS